MKKIIVSKTSNFFRYRSIPWLRAKVSHLSKISYTDIGLERNGEKSPRALMLVPTEPIDYYVQGRYELGLKTKMHNIYFQFLAILKSLVDHGFVVDCVEKDTLALDADTSKYNLILDEGDSLAYLANIPDQIKVFYCTGTKWDRWNNDELQRIEWFYENYGVRIKPVRIIKPIFSDQAADYILYKGVQKQMQGFDENATMVQLAMPVEFEPEMVSRDYTKKEFVWIGGWGALNKGLDLVVDAFEKMPNLKLHIFGPLEKEVFVYKWLQEKIKKNTNIQYHGYADYKSLSFEEIISNCIAHVYPSAGENGCATLAQTAHYGLIPVTTSTANNQANYLGYEIVGNTREVMVDSICKCVEQIVSLSEKDVKERSKLIIDFAKKRFTRSAFIDSFNEFLKINILADNQR